MSIRFLCIASLSKDNVGEILYYRLFLTVEKRCKILHGSEYLQVLYPNLFVENLLIKLGLSVGSKQFVEWRDKASVPMQIPIIDVKVGDHEIWPVIYMIQQSLLICCLPLLEKIHHSKDKEHLINMPSVSVGFSVLLGIHNLMKSNGERIQLLKDVELFLNFSMPFGSPSNLDPSCLALLNTAYSHSYLRKQPAWKARDFQGKQAIHLKISEFVRCSQSKQKINVCYYEVFGQISVNADLEGTLNDVTLTITSSSRPLVLDSVIVHPCVQMHGVATSTAVSNLLRRLRFTPPLHPTILMQYTSHEPKEQAPIKGVFKMVGESCVELLVQLKLSDAVKNNFEYFEVIVVFFNRGPVKSFEYNTNHGVPKLSEDRHSLKWNIGNKFPKEREAAVTAKLDFHDKPIMPHSDPFCINKNCYAQINFKQGNTTLSGCSIDPKSVVASQTNKPKVIVERSVESTEYRLWNDFGDLPFPANLPTHFQMIFT